MLGASDTWLTIHLSQRTSEPVYYIIDWRISKPNHWGHTKGVLLKTFFLNSTETFIVHCQLDRALQLCLHHNINLIHRRLACSSLKSQWKSIWLLSSNPNHWGHAKGVLLKTFFWIPQRLSLCIVNLIELCNYACTIT